MATAAVIKKDADLLHGPLVGKIFAFVLPLILTNVLQNLYNAADMVVVGLSDVEGAIGSIGTTSALISLIINIFMGFAVGTSVMVARAIGEGSQKKTTEAVHTALLVALYSGLLCLVIGLIICRPILAYMGDEGHILDLASLYTKIYFLGVPFIAITNFLIAIFRAKGDTKTPLIVLTITGLINVVLNLFFVLVCHMSVDGVALATSISNFASMIILTIILSKDQGLCHFEFKSLKIEKYALKGIIYNGLPAGIQGGLFSFSNMLIQSSIIGINNTVCPSGSAIIDGNAAGASIESFCYVSINSVTQASVTFASQHYGAKKFKRMKKVMSSCYLVTFIVSEAISLLILALRTPLIKFYLSDPMAIQAANIRLVGMLTVYFTIGFMEVGSGILRGMNRSITSTTVTLLGSCVLRVVWLATYVKSHTTLQAIYLSYPISWSVTAITHFIFCVVTLRHLLATYPED